MRVALASLFLAAVVWGQNPPRITRIVQHGTDLNQLSPNAIASALGTDFGSQPSVTVNNTAAEVVYSSGTSISFRIPPSAPLGQASLVVTTAAGSTAPFPFALVAVSPSILLDTFSSPAAYYHYGPGGPKDLFPQPGDVVSVYVTGFGATLPPPSPKVRIDGNEFPISGVNIVSNVHYGSVLATPTTGPVATFKIPDLQPGRHQVGFQVGGINSGTVPLDLLYSGIITSQTGLTFNAVQGGPAPAAQSVSVLSGVGIINFNLTASTVSGGSWLKITPASGSVQSGQTGVPIRVSADPTGLAAGAYYGTIQVAADGVLNSPQSITVVLRIAPAGTPVGLYLDTWGFIFLATQGGADPAPQSIPILNPTAGSLSVAATGATNQLKYTLSPTNIPSGQSATFTAQASSAGVTPGVYTARISLTFSDQSTRAITLLLVVVSNSAPSAYKPAGPQEASSERNAGGCTPTKLLPVFNQPGSGFSVLAAWPTPIVVSVVDDCAIPLTTGVVNVSFSNGDPPLQMSSLRNGSFAASWAAVSARSTGFSLTATATDPASGLTGSAALTGLVGTNPDVPIISKGGVVDAASYGPALTPGALFAVFGSKLSSSTGPATSLPLPTLLADTTLLMGNKPVPLYYTSDLQLLAMVPYDVAQNTSLQMVARSGNALSSPQPVSVIPVRPAVWTVGASGSGQGHVYRYDAAGNAILADSKSPAKAGDVLVIYCMGLGAVTPPVTAGVAAPLDVLSKTVNPVTATVGGAAAAVAFAGVTPGGTGLYQVNLTVPAGLPDNDATPLILTSGGQSSSIVTFAVRTPK